jgi:heme exporter protein A
MDDIPFLQVQEVQCVRQNRFLFQPVSLELYSGQILHIKGLNGAGKTSLLRILAGLSRPYEGSVQYLSTDIAYEQEAFYADMLYLGHGLGLKSNLSVAANSFFYQQLHQESNSELSSALGALSLSGFEHFEVNSLSAGQQRRVALNRLWLSQKSIWILDEPFTALDTQGIHQLEQLFLAHVQRGGSIVLTSHQSLSIENYEQYRTYSLCQ